MVGKETHRCHGLGLLVGPHYILTNSKEAQEGQTGFGQGCAKTGRELLTGIVALVGQSKEHRDNSKNRAEAVSCEEA